MPSQSANCTKENICQYELIILKKTLAKFGAFVFANQLANSGFLQYKSKGKIIDGAIFINRPARGRIWLIFR